MSTLKQYHPEKLGYETLRGSGVVEGSLLSDCADVFPVLVGVSIWSDLREWRDKILFLGTSEEDMSPELLTYIFRNLAAQGISDIISGALVGKPVRRSEYGSYRDVFRRAVGFEAGRPEPPILCNMNFGHTEPIGILPCEVLCCLDAGHKTLTLLGSVTESYLGSIKQGRQPRPFWVEHRVGKK